MPLHMTIHKGRIATAAMIELRPIIKIAPVLIRAQIRLIKTGTLKAFAEQEGVRGSTYRRGLQPNGGDNQTIHMVRHQSPRHVLRGGTKPDLRTVGVRHQQVVVIGAIAAELPRCQTITWLRRKSILMVLHIQDSTEDNLPEIRSALCLARTVLGFTQCRKEQRSKNRNDDNDHQQFNEAECRDRRMTAKLNAHLLLARSQRKLARAAKLFSNHSLPLLAENRQKLPSSKSVSTSLGWLR